MVQDSPDPALTISFIKVWSLTLYVEMVSALLNPEWELVPQERSLVAEGSTSCSTLTDSRNHKSIPQISDLLGHYGVMSSLRYEGAWFLKDLYVRSRILNSILNFTSQCREAKTAVIWSLLLVPLSSCAAAFWTKWRLFTDLQTSWKSRITVPVIQSRGIMHGVVSPHPSSTY